MISTQVLKRQEAREAEKAAAQEALDRARAAAAASSRSAASCSVAFRSRSRTRCRSCDASSGRIDARDLALARNACSARSSVGSLSAARP